MQGWQEITTIAIRNYKHSFMDYKEQKEKYKEALIKWKSDHFINWYARMPQKPIYKPGQDAKEYANRLFQWNKLFALWQKAPKPEEFGLVNLLNEHFEIRVGLILKFGAQHIRLFNFRLMSELDIFEEFLFKNGFRYEIIEKQGGGVEIDIDSSYDFVFSEESAKFKLAIESADGVHVTGFYFYNENGYKDERQRLNTIADIHDILMKDSRVVTKKIKGEKGCRNFVQDYIATYEAARVEDNSVYITTIERYSKLPMHKWYAHKVDWIVISVAFIIFFLLIIFGLTASHNKDSKPASLYQTLPNIEQVYVCTGPQAKSYHNDANCMGLQSCSAEVEQVSIEEAKDEGRKPCRYCCK